MYRQQRPGSGGVLLYGDAIRTELLPHEDVKDFLRLFDSVEDYANPQTSWDYLVTYQASMLTWEILRYHKMKVGMLLSHQRPALESLLRKFQVRTGLAQRHR